MDVMTMRRALLITVLALAALGIATSTASATFPGRNGPIAFRTVDFETGLGNPLFRAQPDGTQVTQLTDLPGFFSDWRADGQRIAFDFFDADGNEQIATMAADGSDLRVITSGRGIHEVPSWSPNGRRIVFGSSPEPDPQPTPGFETRLWTMRADGSKAKPLRIDYRVRHRAQILTKWPMDCVRAPADHERQARRRRCSWSSEERGARSRQLTPLGEVGARTRPGLRTAGRIIFRRGPPPGTPRGEQSGRQRAPHRFGPAPGAPAATSSGSPPVLAHRAPVHVRGPRDSS